MSSNGALLPGSSYAGNWQWGWREWFRDLQRLNVLASEMEASVIFVLTRVWGLRAGGISVVLDHMLEERATGDNFDPERHLDHSDDNITKLARAGSETVRILSE